jgi:hypothetical protein
MICFLIKKTEFDDECFPTLRLHNHHVSAKNRRETLSRVEVGIALVLKLQPVAETIAIKRKQHSCHENYKSPPKAWDYPPNQRGFPAQTGRCIQKFKTRRSAGLRICHATAEKCAPLARVFL